MNKVEVGKPFVSRYNGFETASKFNRPSVNRKYIKILALCLTYAPASLIYPNTKQPLMHQVRDMCRAGLLERYTKQGSKAYFYKTTQKGRELLIKALKQK